MPPEEIIVYRSPLEKMFWDNAGIFFLFILAFATIFYFSHVLLCYFGFNKNKAHYISIPLGGAAALVLLFLYCVNR
jgi:hypothetical protein